MLGEDGQQLPVPGQLGFLALRFDFGKLLLVVELLTQERGFVVCALLLEEFGVQLRETGARVLRLFLHLAQLVVRSVDCGFQAR